MRSASRLAGQTSVNRKAGAGGGIALAVALVWLALAGAAWAAFPGRPGLLAVQPVSGGGVLLVSADGRSVRRICAESGCATESSPAWSPDGRELAYVGSSSESVDVIYPDGTCLHCGIASSTHVAFTPTGDLLEDSPTLPSGLPRALIGPSKIDVVAVDGLGVRERLPEPGSSPVSSAQGRIAFVRNVRGREEVFVTDTKARHAHQLTRAGASSPSWAPGGRSLAVVHARRIEIVDLRGRVTRVLARGTSPAFAPDGRNVAYVGRGNRLMVIAAGGGRPHPLGAVRAAHVDWQPLPSTAPGVCRVPAGSKGVALSPQAVITSHADPYGSGETAYLACLFSANVQRFLGVTGSSGTPDNGGTSSFSNFVFAGDSLGFVSYSASWYHGAGGSTTSIEARNLLTDVAWSADLPDQTNVISFVLSPQGWGAWEIAGGGPDDTLFVHDAQGTRQLDSGRLGSLAITSDAVTWTNNGQPESATLQQ